MTARPSVPATPAVLGAVHAAQTLRERAQERARTVAGRVAQVDAYMGPAAVLTHPDTGEAVAWRQRHGSGTRIVIAHRED